jgi:hypothetical protein
MEAESGLVPGRLARGSRCFGAWAGHELVGYGWLSTKSEWIGEIELEIGLAPGEAYIWNCVTLNRHRRKGVFRSHLPRRRRAGEEGRLGKVVDRVTRRLCREHDPAGRLRAGVAI